MCRADSRIISATTPRMRRVAVVMPMAFAALLLGACANTARIDEPVALADAGRPGAEPGKPPQTELERALEYWGKKHAASPKDLKSAISFAKNLKAAGEKERALAVLQGASVHHGANKELASEYGRLALEAGQVGLAQNLLELAEDPGKPDWKVVSARGTAFAKQGQFTEAIPFYERAQSLAPDQVSVVSNLAMAYAANGEAPRAEVLLRKIADAPGSDAKIRQNLVLVLGLQGKYDEAKLIAAKDVPPEAASANVEYVRQLVRATPQAAPKAIPAVGRSDAFTPNGAPNAAPAGDWSSKITTASTRKAPAKDKDLRPSQE